jgi:hypothetical protein
VHGLAEALWRQYRRGCVGLPQELDEVMTECREDLPMLISDIYKFFEAVRNRPKVTRKHPGSDAAQGKPAKDKLH